MWNPPLIDEATGARRSALSEAADLLADLVAQGVRTICFLRSRRGIELIQRFARDDARAPRQARAGRADRPLPRRLHAAAAARDRGPAGRRRAARGGRDRRARARDRHRRARRGDLRHLPRHRRQPAADVGAGRAPPARAGGLRRRPGRARPVLLPPPGRVPRAARSRRRSSTTRTSRSPPGTWSPPPTSCRSRDDDDEVFGAGWRERAERLVGAGRAAPAPAAGCCRGAASSSPRGSPCARPRPTRSR